MAGRKKAGPVSVAKCAASSLEAARKGPLDPSVRKGGGVVFDHDRIERAVHDLLLALGENPNRDGLAKTPHRMAKSFEEMLSGYHTDPSRYLETTFKEEHRELVILKDIPFFSLCEHHLLPFFGKAYVAYLPSGEIVGLSKLARLVDGYARRLQVQERLTDQIADALMNKLKPQGAAVLLEGTHLCMTMRGIQKPGTIMMTSAIRGIFATDHASRDEVWAHFYHRHDL